MTPATQADEFQRYYPLLFSIAYRMLGSASDAEDIVQDAYLRYAQAPGEIHALKSFLTTVVTNLCLDHLKSARVRREQYVGPWLPEPVITTDGALAPLETVEQRESVSLAFLVLLESLTPQERAVFLLHDVFEYGYDEIAGIVGKSAATCRQILHRARARVAERRPRFEPSPEAQRRLTERFLVAANDGNVAALTDILARDVIAWSDGGGKVHAATRPVYGPDRVIRFLLGLVRKAPPGARIALAEINGGPALLGWDGATLFLVLTFDIAEDRIHGVRLVVNPDKLAYVAQQITGPAGEIIGGQTIQPPGLT
jgi:RNA polymerase sigma-70 factor, ECF subfamily